MIQSASIGGLSITSESLQLDEEGPEGAALTWRRHVVTSPFVDGEYEISAVKDAGQLSMRVWALGTSTVELRNAVRSLLVAVEQPAYPVDIRADAFAMHWDCRRADYQVGLRSGLVRGLAVPVSLTIPYFPTASAALL